MKKKFKNILVIFTLIIIVCSNISFATEDVYFKKIIKEEDGSLFEKIIAETIGGIAQTVFNIANLDIFGVGFKNYDAMIFNKNLPNDSLSPFSIETWNKVMDWYKIFSVMSGSLILIGVVILSYKLIMSGINVAKKNEVKDSLMRLIFGGVAIALCPLFIRFLLFINNSLVHILLTATNGGLNDLLGNGMLSSIRTGNCIATALVIAMFIYLFVKLNIKFIIREFTLIVFTIFTPIVAGLWIINKNVTAAVIWSGQILINIFMQFIYSFLFLLYLSFLPSSSGWAITLIWAMMLLPLADTLQNCLQNLTSRKAGIDNNEITSRALGMGNAFGYSLSTIKNQFSSNNGQNINSNGNTNLFSNFMGKMKTMVSPQTMNLSSEKDYNGNINPIRNVVSLSKENTNQNIPINNVKTNDYSNNNANNNSNSRVEKVLSVGAKATGAYLSIGAKMAEGNFGKQNNNIQNNYKGNYNNTISAEYHNKLTNKEKSDKKDE